MAHFYGTLRGQRGQASRLGGKGSGLETYAASWEGAVLVRLWVDEVKGVDMCLVTLTPHKGVGTSKVLYEGPVSGRPVTN